jgi:hypothetical protein
MTQADLKGYESPYSLAYSDIDVELEASKRHDIAIPRGIGLKILDLYGSSSEVDADERPHDWLEDPQKVRATFQNRLLYQCRLR